jgi:hypothetical protein
MDFELIFEYSEPVAAILFAPQPAAIVHDIYRLLPQRSVLQPALADRWNAHAVLSSDDWASSQLRRRPMLKPTGLKLRIVQ